MAARLFIVGEKELKSSEGTTQGDPLAMSIYAISLQPLITQLNVSSFAKHGWFKLQMMPPVLGNWES